MPVTSLEGRAAAARDRSAESESAAQSSSSARGTQLMSKKWYVVQAYSGYEGKVKSSLEERIRQANMDQLFGDILIPKENVTENRPSGRRVTSRTFYPG